MMDPDVQETEVFSDTEVLNTSRAEEEDEREEVEEEEEEEDARIFNAWMQQYRRGEQQKKTGEKEEEEEEAEGRRAESRSSLEPPVRMRTDRRASLPCPATLSSMQLSRLHLSTGAPVTARVMLRASSCRRLLPSPQEAIATPVPAAQRRPSLIPTIPEAMTSERRGQFRRRNVMSLCIEEWLWRKQSCPTCHVQVSMPQPVYWSSTRVKVP
ncbi:hypothetical protein PAMA_014610 [Pampus argenteus]